MHILIAIVGAIAAAYFFFIRARNTAEMTGELIDAANDVRLAARRFGFKRKANIHPAETIEDPHVAMAGIGTSFLELDGMPTKEQRSALINSLARSTGLATTDADELCVLGRWMMGECGGAQQAVPRLSRKLYKLSGIEGFGPIMAVIKDIAEAGSGALSSQHRTALEDLQSAFRIK